MQSQHLRKLALGTLIVLGFTTLSTPIGYISRLVLARAVSIEEYGLFYAIVALFWFFITFNDLGFGYSILYFVPKWVKEKKFKTIWNAFIYELFLEIGTTLIIGTILFTSAQWLSVHYFNDANATLIIRILLLYFLGNSLLSALKRVFNGLQQEYYYASVEFIRLSLITLAGAFALWQGETRLWVYAIIWASTHLFLAGVYSILFYKKNNYLISKPDWDKSLFQSMLVYAIPTLIVQSVSVFTSYADTIILTVLEGTTVVGLYNVFYPIASIPLFLLAPLSTLLLPFYSYHIQDGKTKLKTISYFFLKVLIFSGLYFGVFISTYSDESIRFLFGEKWLQLGSLGLKILSLGFIFQLLTIFYVTVVNGLGMVKTRMKISILTSLLIIVLGVIFTKVFGLVGLISANIIVYIVSSILFGKVVHDKLSMKVPFQFGAGVSLVIISLGIVLHILFPSPQNWTQFIVVGIIYSLAILSFGYILFKSELKSIIGELKKAQNK